MEMKPMVKDIFSIITDLHELFHLSLQYHGASDLFQDLVKLSLSSKMYKKDNFAKIFEKYELKKPTDEEVAALDLSYISRRGVTGAKYQVRIKEPLDIRIFNVDEKLITMDVSMKEFDKACKKAIKQFNEIFDESMKNKILELITKIDVFNELKISCIEKGISDNKIMIGISDLFSIVGKISEKYNGMKIEMKPITEDSTDCLFTSLNALRELHRKIQICEKASDEYLDRHIMFMKKKRDLAVMVKDGLDNIYSDFCMKKKEIVDKL